MKKKLSIFHSTYYYIHIIIATLFYSFYLQLGDKNYVKNNNNNQHARSNQQQQT